MLYLDTSVLVPLFVPEPESAALRDWFDRNAAKPLATSEWALTEFASAMGIKVREKGLRAAQADEANALMRGLAAYSLRVFAPNRTDFSKAAQLLAHYNCGLRAGDALHLAVAQNEEAACVYTFDRRLIEAGRKLKIRVARPL